jgi:hypothetical protein
MKLVVVRRRSSSAGPGFEGIDWFPRHEGPARAAGDKRKSEIFREQFLFFHHDPARIDEESGVGNEGIGHRPLARDPGDRFALRDANIDLVRHFPLHLHFINLGQVLQPIVHLS